MALANFLKNFGAVKYEQGSEGLVNFLASVDADGVSETAIKQKQEEHDAIVKQVIEAQNDLKKEKKEFDDVLAEYNQKLAGVERAQAALDADPNNSRAATAIVELLEAVEKLAPKLDKEKREYEDAERWLKEIQQASDEIARELLGLREQINEAKQANKQAELDLERANKQVAQAEQLAGLRKASNKFNTAMSALQKQAAEKQAEADAAKLKAQQLSVKPTAISSAAAEFLTDAPTTSTESVSERLARLKAKV